VLVSNLWAQVHNHYSTEEPQVKYPVYASSPAAASLKGRVGVIKYPWKELEEGQSFLVPSGEGNWITISTACYKWSKKLGKKFRAVNHGADGIEVARLKVTNNE